MSRRELFESIERPALRPLPEADWQFAEWRLVRVGLDYHVEVDGFYYSVPHALIRAEVDTRLTERTLEVFHRGKRVAAHQRRYGGRRHGTDPEHMPSAHRRYAEWSPARFQRWAKTVGPATETLIVAVLANRPHPEQVFRTEQEMGEPSGLGHDGRQTPWHGPGPRRGRAEGRRHPAPHVDR
jgi:transposase